MSDAPTVEELAAREDVWRREKHRTVDAETFADARERIDAGLDWGVGAVVTDDADRVLLVEEGGRWLVPGGEVEDGEGHEEALVREVREETGVEIRPGSLVAVTEVTFAHAGTETGFAFAHYTATARTTDLSDDPGLADEDIQTVAWRLELPENLLDREVVERFR